MKVKAATFDIGGVLYSDDDFKRAIFSALNQLTTVTQADFDQVYHDHLKQPDGSLRSKLCLSFLGSLDKKSELMQLADEKWLFNDADQYQDGKECLIKLKQMGLKIGIVANQPKAAAERLKQDNLFELINFLGISAIVGFEKPDPAFFKLAIKELDLPADQIINLGNRIYTVVNPV